MAEISASNWGSAAIIQPLAGGQNLRRGPSVSTKIWRFGAFTSLPPSIRAQGRLSRWS